MNIQAFERSWDITYASDAPKRRCIPPDGVFVPFVAVHFTQVGGVQAGPAAAFGTGQKRTKIALGGMIHGVVFQKL